MAWLWFLSGNFLLMALTLFVVFVVLPATIIWFVSNQYRIRQRSKVSYKGKVALVTGSANGLGKSITLALAEEKCHLICVDVDEKGNQDTIERVKLISPTSKVFNYKCDISNCDEVKKLAEQVYQNFDCVDILINNAGVAYPCRLLSLTDEHVRRIININLLSHLWMIRSFLPKMIAQDSGHIVGIASIAAKFGTECLVPYCATKSGVAGLMEALQHELSHMRANVNTLTVYPGFMGTQLMPNKYMKPGFHFIGKNIPLHVADTKDVAAHIIDAMKDEQHQLTYPYYFIAVLTLVRVIPEFLVDYFQRTLLKLYPHIDPVKSCQ